MTKKNIVKNPNPINKPINSRYKYSYDPNRKPGYNFVHKLIHIFIGKNILCLP